MQPRFTWTLIGYGFGTATRPFAAETMRRKAIPFGRNATSAVLKGMLRGRETVDYQLTAEAGRSLTVAFGPDNSAAYFHVPPRITENPQPANGYPGHDAFAVVENALVQRFPVYRDRDPDGKPRGGMRQIQYRLKPGEAGRRLALDRLVEY